MIVVSSDDIRCNWHRIGMVEGDHGWSCPMCPGPYAAAEIERLRTMTAEQALVHDAWMTERALADRLAGALSADPQQDMGIGRRAALAAHEEARRER